MHDDTWLDAVFHARPHVVQVLQAHVAQHSLVRQESLVHGR